MRVRSVSRVHSNCGPGQLTHTAELSYSRPRRARATAAPPGAHGWVAYGVTRNCEDARAIAVTGDLNTGVSMVPSCIGFKQERRPKVLSTLHAMQVGIKPNPMRVPRRKSASPRRGLTRESKEDGATAGGSTYSTRGCRAPRSEQARKCDERDAPSVKARRFDRGLEYPHSTSTDGDAEIESGVVKNKNGTIDPRKAAWKFYVPWKARPQELEAEVPRRYMVGAKETKVGSRLAAPKERPAVEKRRSSRLYHCTVTRIDHQSVAHTWKQAQRLNVATSTKHAFPDI
ncbi:hypothetical protein B0H14DRAFT_2645477 [Mycena olivaceomarginata]|nr:hypothetical protein B0H14DRAFT_2645477 [Mycena olivaceomarginata]